MKSMNSLCRHRVEIPSIIIIITTVLGMDGWIDRTNDRTNQGSMVT